MSLLAGRDPLARVLQALLFVVLGALIFGRFCLGSFVFHLLNGNGESAKRTLPWGRGAVKLPGDAASPGQVALEGSLLL